MSSSTSTQRGASRRNGPSSGTARRGAGRSSATRGGNGSGRRTSSPVPSRAPRSRAASPAKRRAGALSKLPLVPVIAVAGVLVLGWALYPALKLQYQASRQVGGLEQQYQTLRARNDTLEAEVAALKTPAGVEQAAQQSLGFTKAGEHMYVVIPSAGASATSSGQPSESAMGGGQRSALQVILDWVFGVSDSSPDRSAP